jgi:Phosphoesterase family
MASLPPITNIVVLMLENRSFDNVLGWLYPYSANFEGLKGTEYNSDSSGKRYTITNNPSTTLMPPVDPGESFEDMNLQIWGNTNGTGSQSMSGFVLDYLATPQQYPDIRTNPGYFYPTLPRAGAYPAGHDELLHQLRAKRAAQDHGSFGPSIRRHRFMVRLLPDTDTS